MILQSMPTAMFLGVVPLSLIGAIIMAMLFIPMMEELRQGMMRFQRVLDNKEFRKWYIEIWIGNVCLSSIIFLCVYAVVIMTIYYFLV